MPLETESSFLDRIRMRYKALKVVMMGDGFIIISMSTKHNNVQCAWNVELSKEDARNVLHHLVREGPLTGAI